MRGTTYLYDFLLSTLYFLTFGNPEEIQWIWHFYWVVWGFVIQLALFEGPVRVLAKITTDSTYSLILEWLQCSKCLPTSLSWMIDVSLPRLSWEHNTILWMALQKNSKYTYRIGINYQFHVVLTPLDRHQICSWSRCPPFFASRPAQAFQVSSDLSNNTSSPRKWGHLSDIKRPMGSTIHGWRLHDKWYLSLCLIMALHNWEKKLLILGSMWNLFYRIHTFHL